MRSNRSMPAAAVMPVLRYEDVGEACEWLCAAFGFTERWRIENHRAQLAIGDCAVAIAEGPVAPEASSVLVRVDDADTHHEQALRHGARILQPPTEFPYGEKQYTAEDLAGRRWTFSETVADVAPEEWGAVSGAG